MINRFTLRTRLVMVSVLAAILALLAANILSFVSLQRTLINRIDASLRTVALPIGDPQTRPRFPPAFSYELRSADGNVVEQVDATDDHGDQVRPFVDARLDLNGTSADPTGKALFFTAHASGTDTQFRVKAAKFTDGRILILASTLDDTEDALGETLKNQLLITFGVALSVALLAWFLITRSLKPLTDLQQTATMISAGDRTARVKASGPSDVHLLGDTFNTMVDQLDQSISSEKEANATTRRFVDDAAHELRTPTTAIVAYAQLLGSRRRTEEEVVRINKGIAVESDRLRQLVDELLLLARTDQNSTSMRTYGVTDLSAIALQAVDASILVGPSYPIDLDAPDNAECVGSAVELRRIFDNLLTNIRTHTPAGTSGKVVITTTATEVVVRVEDDGPVIDPAHLTPMFDRFWRGDTSRTRATGGNGLGLSIVKALIEQHGGTIHASANPTGGTRIEFRLPNDSRV
jgi:two-component system, OmpR family, sensor kinase